MQMAPFMKKIKQMVPSFYKILLDPPAHHMSLQPDFVMRNKIPNGEIIRYANGGYSRRLKINHISDSYLSSNRWNNVVQEDIMSDSGDEDDEKGGKEEEDDDSYWLTNVWNNVVDILLDSGDESDVDEEEKEDDDDDDVTYDYDNYDNDDDDYDDGNGDDENNEEEKGDDDPFFVSILTRGDRILLLFPVEFARSARINRQGTMTVKNLDGTERVMGLRLDTKSRPKRYYLSTGWQRFWQENNLSEGDKCEFKFIRSERKLLLAKVTKKKTKVVKRARGRRGS
ncbi:putative acting on peptide bonds (peptidase) transcription factor B3-Domain family [Helianthus anomalus]